MRLNQFSSENAEINQDTVMRHDLFEIDRKRKLLLEEVEAIRKKKYEELDSLKRIEAQKSALLKDLMTTQEAIEKHAQSGRRGHVKDIINKQEQSMKERGLLFTSAVFFSRARSSFRERELSTAPLLRSERWVERRTPFP